MGSSSRLNSRIFTNSFSHKEYEMARPLLPHTYFERKIELNIHIIHIIN